MSVEAWLTITGLLVTAALSINGGFFAAAWYYHLEDRKEARARTAALARENKRLKARLLRIEIALDKENILPLESETYPSPPEAHIGESA